MKLGDNVTTMKPGTRDAIHLPVVVTKAVGHVKPGDRVVFTSKDLSTAGAPKSYELWHGIMDPLTTASVEAGGIFLVLINPALMAGQPLRHDFDVSFDPVNDSQIDGWNCSSC